METPLVSITIPTKNSGDTIEECLKSARNQTYSNIELIVIDTQSTDNTLEISKKYSSKIINTEWKLLGSRFLGLEASNGEYVLLLDSDQILYPDTVERLVEKIKDYDMLCLEETSHNPRTFIEKLFDADRQLINSMPELHLDPMDGVMLARFYKKSILSNAFQKIPIEKLHDVGAHDHAIIYYEAYKISRKVSIVKKAVLHNEPSSFRELWCQNYKWGKSTKELIENNLYIELLKKKTRFRKGTSLTVKSVQSTILMVLKAIPYFIGLKSS